MCHIRFVISIQSCLFKKLPLPILPLHDLQPRPANLPPKSLEEEQKHRQLYEEMVQEAKKRELKDVKLKRKQVRMGFVDGGVWNPLWMVGVACIT